VNAPSAPAAARPFAVFDGRRAASLDDLEGLAELQSRFDRKYVVPVDELPALETRLADRVRILEVEARREFTYDTWYLDTPDLRTYRDHVQGRRRRFKLRTRTYVEQSLTMLEVKLKGVRGRTVKRRTPLPGGDPAGFGNREVAFFERVLDEEYGVACPSPLAPRAMTRYVRTTLVDLDLGERVTLDHGFEVAGAGRRVVFDPDLVLLEVKTPTLRAGTAPLLGSLGLRPVVVSKYGLAVTTLYDDRAGNRWRPVLRRLSPRSVPPGAQGHVEGG
jgi:hypothetical protein